MKQSSTQATFTSQGRRPRGGVLLFFIFFLFCCAVFADTDNGNVKTALEGKSYFSSTGSDIKVSAKDVVVTGTVKDPEGQPLPGVSVKIKGAKSGTSTDVNGNFRVSVSGPQVVLVFSFVGFQTQEVRVGNRTVIEVKLAAKNNTLSEVVVVGYGTQTREQVTAAVASVKQEDFNAGGVRSPLDLIQGKVAGVSITRTQGNNPNASAAVQLRGVSSLTGSQSPLIVIDGIPGGNLDLLQQDDIESFDVLKDGSAAAIYGTRGNAGVILITTKKGKAGDPTYEYSTYFQREAVAKRPEMLSAEEFKSLVAASNDLGSITDVYDMLINKDNLSQYHNLAASGGSPKTNYRASLYYNDAQGVAKENGREQYGGRLNINQKGLQDRLALQTNFAINLNKANLLGGSTGDFEQSIQRNPTAPIYNPDGTFLETSAFNNYNPVARLNQELSERNQQTFSGDAKLTLDVYKGLRVSAFGALIRDSYTDRQYISRDAFTSKRNYQGTGYASKFNRLDQNYTFETTADYSSTIADNHSVNAVVGYSYQYFTREESNLNNSGFLTDAFLDWNIGAGNAITNTLLPRPGLGSFKEDNTLIAFFGRVNYSYREKYLLSAILRREGSSRFGANHKWGNFPALSLGWNIYREEFMQNVKFINNLKVRAGYGVTGNQGIPNYQSLITLGTGGQYLQNGVWFQTYGPSRNPNPDLRWEKKKELNAGIDFAVLNNIISGSIDLYSRKTTDLLLGYTAQVPPYVNNSIYTNVGTISNKGIEVVLSGRPIKKKDFKWNIDATFSANNDKLSKLSNDVFKATFLERYGLPSPGNLGNAMRIEEGQPFGNFYGKRFAGFNEQGKWLFYKKDGSAVTADKINNEDLGVIGNALPRYYASLSNTFTYNNFDLTVFFRGKFGYKILNTQDLFFGNKAWLPNNLLRSAVTKHSQLNDAPQYSDYYLEPGSFVKLDNLTLGYNFRLKTNYIRTLRLYATTRNLITITKYSGLDPELQDVGFDEVGVDTRGFYPRTRSFTLGLKVGF